MMVNTLVLWILWLLTCILSKLVTGVLPWIP